MTGMTMEVRQMGDVRYTAGFGPGGNLSVYRYTLGREWQHIEARAKQRHALFIMLNPSTADAFKDDPTVAKCGRFARAWGFDAVEVRNVFAYRSTDPMVLRLIDDPVGPENNAAIMDAVNDQQAGIIVAAWGNHGMLRARSTHVREMLKRAARPVFSFRVCHTGEPSHPLYVPERGITPEHLVRYV